MKTLRNTSTRRLVILLALTPLVWLVGACERQSDEPNAPSPGSAVSDSFTLPEVDVIALPLALQERLRVLREAVRTSPRNPDQVGALGAIYFTHGLPQAAATCFLRAKELAPHTMPWWYYLGLAHERAGEREKALAAYERALELDASYGPLYVKLAGLLLPADRARALGLAQRALELNPKDSTAIFVLGRCDEAGGQPDEARRRFEEALGITANYKEAHEALARVLAAMERTEEAERHLAAAKVGKTPVIDDPFFEMLLRNGLHLEILLRDALVLAERGEFEQADNFLEVARGVDRIGMATRRATGMVRAMQGRLEEAAAEFRAVLEASPDALNVRAQLADVQARLGNHTEAEAGFRAVLERSPDDMYALERYTLMLRRLERVEEAEALLRAAVERQPDRPWIRFQLGYLLFNMNKDDEARQQFEACLELSPRDAGARYSLGLLARRAGDLAGAREHWKRVVETTPDFLEAYVALAKSAMQERDLVAAERYIREGVKRAPNSAGLANGLAWILATSPDESQRNGEEAVQLAEKACELTQNRQHEYVDTLAAAYAEVGRFDDAVKTARSAIGLAEEAKNEEGVAMYRQRLELYEKKQPYRDLD